MQNYNKQIASWLFLCCFMVVLMVMIGGLTRLTGSGLSMTGWEPVTAWLPPIGDAAWQQEFARYQTSPQYLKINIGMSVEEFKGIFWLEYVHRLIGRIAGVIFLLPLLYFAYKRAIDKPLLLRFSSIFVLGGVQGVIGWLMVSSGLQNEPHVSQYWLAFHLSTAFILFAILFIIALGRYYKSQTSYLSDNYVNVYKLQPFAIAVTILIFAQIIMGAFVAGLHAGLIYNTFPLMDGKWIPEGLFPFTPLHENLFEDIKTVQFIHRTLAYLVCGSIILLWEKAKKLPKSRFKSATNALLAMVFVQFSLGVLTLLHAVPTPLASMHQIGALVLFTISLYTNYVLLYKHR
jgi:cytochrome c oxidase assembly protein subunit 15